MTPRQVERKQAEGALIVDVRTDLQFDDAHIPGAVCNPAVRAGFGTSGQRSAVAASLLLRQGARQVIHVADGGVGTWKRPGWPIEQPDQSTASVR